MYTASKQSFSSSSPPIESPDNTKEQKTVCFFVFVCFYFDSRWTPTPISPNCWTNFNDFKLTAPSWTNSLNVSYWVVEYADVIHTQTSLLTAIRSNRVVGPGNKWVPNEVSSGTDRQQVGYFVWSKVQIQFSASTTTNSNPPVGSQRKAPRLQTLMFETGKELWSVHNCSISASSKWHFQNKNTVEMDPESNRTPAF